MTDLSATAIVRGSDDAAMSEAARQLLDEFDDTWRHAELQQALSKWLAKGNDLPANDLDRFRRELIKIDLEYRWRHAGTEGVVAGSCGLTLEDYIATFPELGTLSDLSLDLIGEEYRVRQRFGDRPSHAAYSSRFPWLKTSLAIALVAIDRDLTREFAGPDTPTTAQAIAAEPTTAASSSADVNRDAPLEYTDYVLQQQLGAGGMGKVYLAWQKSRGRHVAIKVLRKAYLRIPGAVKRFLEEARYVARLCHPGIIGVHGLGRFPGGGYFIALDYIAGGDLAALRAHGLIEERDIIRWMKDVTSAIAYANSHGVIHCDLKPSNVLLDVGGSAIVTDFGLARPATTDLPGLADLGGTAAFMAPEQIDGAWGPIGPATDVHGLGACLFALLTGEAPHAGGTLVDVLDRITRGDLPTPIQLRRPDVSGQLTEICERCLQPAPGDRWSNAEQVMAELRKLSGDVIGAA